MHNHKAKPQLKTITHKIIISIFLLLALSACNPSPDEADVVLTVGLLPDKSERELLNQYQPLFRYLSEKTAIQFNLVVPKSYSELLSMFEEQTIDIAYFGGYTFVTAQKNNPPFPLVMRDIDKKFSSVLIVREDSDFQSIEDLKASNFSFGSKLSTSGHLMPRFYLTQAGFIPESHFAKILYSGSHDKTLSFVLDKSVQAGIINANYLEQLSEQETVKAQAVRVLWRTKPYPNYVWASQPYIPKAVRKKLVDAFLALNRKQHQAILNAIGANHFVKASYSDFSDLDQAIELINQLPQN